MYLLKVVFVAGASQIRQNRMEHIVRLQRVGLRGVHADPAVLPGPVLHSQRSHTLGHTQVPVWRGMPYAY